MAETVNITSAKTCTACGSVKPATEEFFHVHKSGKLGLRAQCRDCRKARMREMIKEPHHAAKRKAFQEAHTASGRKAELNREWRRNNPESAALSAKRYREKNREKKRAYDQRWRDANRDLVRAKQDRAYRKEMSCPAKVLKRRIRARLREMVKGIGSVRTEAILGYTKEQLATHIQRQFTKGMTWEKLMSGEIHIDHITPVSSFSITGIDCAEFRACWALPNLRPMWAIENQRKQAKIEQLL